MTFLRITPFVLAATAFASQGHAATTGTSTLPDHATLPITFTAAVNAAHAKAGDLIKARTTQAVRLTDGSEVPSGAVVMGHVLTAKSFTYDKTPYAKQTPGALEIQFDTLQAKGMTIPLHVTLRALADPLASTAAAEPTSSDNDPLGTLTQIGGDQLIPSQREIRDRNDDVVGYNKKGGAYAHLIANSRDSVDCDGGDTEQPVSQFSASACGLYGFSGVALSGPGLSRIALSSTRATPQIWKYSKALLEVSSDSSGN